MRVNRLGRGALLCGLLNGLLLAGCAHSSRVQRQAQPDGSYRVDCDRAAETMSDRDRGGLPERV